MKKNKFYIVKFPKGEQVLVKSSWSGLIPYADYLKDEFTVNTLIIPINRFEVIRFILKGSVF